MKIQCPLLDKDCLGSYCSWWFAKNSECALSTMAQGIHLLGRITEIKFKD